MKTLLTTVAIALMAGAGATAPAAAAPPTHTPPVPFSGTVSGPDSYAPPTDCPAGASWRYGSEATGQLSHLGKVTLSTSHCSFGDTTSFSGGETTITAADGSRLFLEYAGTFELTYEGGVPVYSDVELTWSVVGGDGRFAGASGSGTGDGFSLIDGFESDTTMTYDGTISLAVGPGK